MNIRLTVLLAFVLASVSVPALAQDSQTAEETQNIQDAQTPQTPDAPAVADAGQDPQSGQAVPDKKKESPPEPESHGTRLRWQDIPRNVLHDEKAIFLSPFRINRENAKWWLLFGATTAGFIAADQSISDNLPETTFLTTPSKWFSRIGADYAIYPLWASFYVVGKFGDNPRARDTGRIGIEALIDADLTAGAIKLITQRPRPEHKGDSVGFWEGGDAFPSGHSIKSWALARVVAREYPHPRIIPILAYAAASSVSIARFGGRRHSASDAVAGAAMGFFIGDFVYRHHHAPSQSPLAWLAEHVNFNFSITPRR